MDEEERAANDLEGSRAVREGPGKLRQDREGQGCVCVCVGGDRPDRARREGSSAWRTSGLGGDVAGVPRYLRGKGRLEAVMILRGA